MISCDWSFCFPLFPSLFFHFFKVNQKGSIPLEQVMGFSFILEPLTFDPPPPPPSLLSSPFLSFSNLAYLPSIPLTQRKRNHVGIGGKHPREFSRCGHGDHERFHCKQM
jgi:hypothetical protein